MKFIELNEKEFTDFATNHPMGNFHQTIGWGKLKQTTGWNYYLIGLKEDDKVIAASLILEKPLALGLSLFYAPRGFLLDYQNNDLLTTFINHVKQFAKKHHAIFIKIDPYVLCHERDINGEIVEGGINNEHIIASLKNLGLKHNGYTLEMEDLQPRWAFALDLKGKTKEDLSKNLESKTRQLIHKNEKNGIYTREIKRDEVEVFKSIMQHTAERRGFIDRSLAYYQNMLDCLGSDTKILVSEISFQTYLDTIIVEIKETESMRKNKQADIEDAKKNVNIEKTKKKIIELDATITRLNKKKSEAEQLLAENGDIVVLGGIIFMFQKRGVVSLFGGAYDKFMNFLSPYTTNWNMIQYALEQGYEKYNFYGISGDFTHKDNEMYGLYDFKRGFGGHVEEYIGEFDLIISKPMYILYHLAFNVYGKIKSLRK